MAVHFWAVIPAAGVGARMGAPLPKQYLSLAGRTVIEHTLERFLAVEAIAGIVVAVAAGDSRWTELARGCDPRVVQAPGGAERCHSVLSALQVLAPRAAADDWVLVHDAARPCIRPADIRLLMRTLEGDPVGGLLGLPVRDTMKRCGTDGRVSRTVDREGLWHALTPQMFRLGTLASALESAVAAGRLVTDEAEAVELAGLAPRLVEGHADNIKITRPVDRMLAELYLRQQQEEACA